LIYNSQFNPIHINGVLFRDPVHKRVKPLEHLLQLVTFNQFNQVILCPILRVVPDVEMVKPLHYGPHS